MKGTTILLFGAIFVVLVVSYVESGYADHLEGADGIFSSMKKANITVSMEDSKYQIHLQIIIRNVDGDLINIVESTSAAFVPHKITDHVFDTVFGEKEIVIVNGIKYEKIQYVYIPNLQERYMHLYPIFSEVKFNVDLTPESVKKMHKDNQYKTNMKLHYCANFDTHATEGIGNVPSGNEQEGEEGHGFQCIAVFFCLVPAVTLEPTDSVTQQWTILRMID